MKMTQTEMKAALDSGTPFVANYRKLFFIRGHRQQPLQLAPVARSLKGDLPLTKRGRYHLLTQKEVDGFMPSLAVCHS
jgi:hypothetical protein